MRWEMESLLHAYYFIIFVKFEWRNVLNRNYHIRCFYFLQYVLRII